MNADCFLEHYERIADVPDAISRLRRFILDLAVRGKLVQQESSDEPASELLDRIAKDKREFHVGRKGRNSEEIAAGKFVELLDHEFLPSGWECVAFGNLVTELATGPFGSMLHQTDYVNDGIPVINPSHMIGGEIVPESRVSISREKAEQLAAYRLSPGDIVLARRGEVGRAAIVREVAKGWICGTGSFYVKLHKDLDRRFLMIVLEAPSTRSYLVGASVGTTMTNLNHGILRRLLVCVPPPEEQKRISAKVLELMGLCDHWEAARAECEAMRDRFAIASFARLNMPDPDATVFAGHVHSALGSLKALTTRPDQIKHLRQAILNLAVRGKLVPQDPKDESALELLMQIGVTKGRQQRKDFIEGAYELPSSWEWSVLGELIDFGPQNGISPRKTDRNDAPKAITLTATTSGIFIPRHYKRVEAKIADDSEFWLREGDLLFQRGNTRDYVGIAAIYHGPPKTFLFPDLIIKVRLSPPIDLRFIHLIAVSPPSRSYFSMNASGAQATMPKINHSILVNLPIPVPPLAEQYRIVEKVEKLMALCDCLEASLAASDGACSRLLDALLAEALMSVDQARQDGLLGVQALAGHFHAGARDILPQEAKKLVC